MSRYIINLHRVTQHSYSLLCISYLAKFFEKMGTTAKPKDESNYTSLLNGHYKECKRQVGNSHKNGFIEVSCHTYIFTILLNNV